MDRFQQLLKAIDSYGTTDLIDYWSSHLSADIKSDLMRLAKNGAPADNTDKDLRAFTIAAMQGILSTLPGNIDISEKRAAIIAVEAKRAAQATLAELSKHQ
jgi:hypothetical protein